MLTSLIVMLRHTRLVFSPLAVKYTDFPACISMDTITDVSTYSYSIYRFLLHIYKSIGTVFAGTVIKSATSMA